MKIVGVAGAILGFILMLLLLSFVIFIFILKSIEYENDKK